MNLTQSHLAIVGLGYVGLPLAVEFGKHRPVLGFDAKFSPQTITIKSGFSAHPSSANSYQ